MFDYGFLIESAKNSLVNSYSPYSNFAVGAAVLTKCGKVFCGVNIENASYGATICGERVAMAKAISEGFREYSAIAVVSLTGNPCFPCGICRQVFMEFSPNMDIVLLDKNNQVKIFAAKDLLPYAFNLSEKQVNHE